jgi:hypothetical protein
LLPPTSFPPGDLVPVSGDFDGNGSLDLAVLDLGSANLSIFLNQPFKALSRTSLDFHSQGITTTSDLRFVNITNPSGAPFSITNIAISGAPFSQTSVCVTKLMPGQSCNINVTFAPTVTGTSNGSLTITATASATPQVIALTGIGVGGPFVQLSATQLGFAPTTIGVPSQGQRVSFENTGNSSLTVSSIAINGGNSGDFSVSGDPCTGIAAGNQCTRTVTFTPTAAGLRKSSMVIMDNAPGSPHIVTLLGTSLGSQVALTPSSLTFGAQAVGAMSAAQTVTLTNRSTVGVFITQIAASGDFQQTNNCGGALNDMATCTISVIFTPSAGGARTGTLTVAAGTGSPLTQTIPLSGTGGDFSVSAGSGGAGATATVAAGATATYPLSLTAGVGFSGTVALTCSGAPTAATCSISPTSLTLSGGTPATATVSVATTARSAVFIPALYNRGDFRWRMFVAPGLLAMSAALTMLVLLGLLSRRKHRPSWVPLATFAIFVLFAGIVVNGCGGGSSNPPSNPTGGIGTAAGTYTITVTATAGSGANAINHTTKLSLVVQ